MGKTLSKVSLWSRSGAMLAREVRANAVIEADGIRRLDVAAIGEWLRGTLASFAAHRAEYIVPVAHGAAAAALVDGALAFPPLDYEQALPAELLAQYRSLRGPFAETGSPALPQGLNLGAQLFMADQLYPAQMARAALVPLAQYWAWFLSGAMVSEVTSLGCHTDLWNPDGADFSALARARGWAEKFAPLAKAGDVVGTLRPELAVATGLSPTVKVLAGLHDSNAALLAARGFAAIEAGEATVLSTGTWFIAMRLAGAQIGALPESRDCLVNVDAFGLPVPSARFMGGREIESLIQIDTRRVDIRPDQPALLAAVPALVASGAMVLPTLARGCGPFPAGQGGWTDPPADWFARRAGACLYAALVTDAMLDLIGSTGCLLIEGRFAEAEVFTRALASLRPDMAIHVANAHNDVGLGAIRLIDPAIAPAGQLRRVEPLGADLTEYRRTWRNHTRQREQIA